MPFLSFSYTKNEDFRLWQEMKLGNKKALDKIFNEHVNHLISYGHSFTQDDYIIDDCIQNVFCRIWQMRSQLKDTDNIRYYLMASLRKELLKEFRKKNKNILLIQKLFSETLLTFNSPLESKIIQEDSHRQQVKILKRGFKKLSLRQREVIYLKYYNELSYDEISEIMGLRKKSVYNAVAKGIVILRRELEK